jgi:hypothetical protein
MRPLRLLTLLFALLIILVAGMISATMLDFEPGAWVAFVAVVLLTAGWFAGWLPGGWDIGGE